LNELRVKRAASISRGGLSIVILSEDDHDPRVSRSRLPSKEKTQGLNWLRVTDWRASTPIRRTLSVVFSSIDKISPIHSHPLLSKSRHLNFLAACNNATATSL
jgi:hypothetical protein